MLILLNKDCQQSNRLLLAAHCIATAIDSKQKLKLVTFYDLKKYYNCKFETDSNLISLPEGNRIKKYVGMVYRRLRSTLNVYEPQKVIVYQMKLSKINKRYYDYRNKIHYIHNWYYRNYLALEKHQDQIRDFFGVKEQYVKQAQDNLKFLRKSGDILVAVHIRRGDYASWRNGQFLYDFSFYKRWIEEVNNELKSINKRGKFIVFSNALIPSDFLISNAEIVISNGSSIEDQYIMSKCDYIIGPPSTFSWWAAFMGKCQYCIVYSQEQKINLSSFTNEFQKEFNSGI